MNDGVDWRLGKHARPQASEHRVKATGPRNAGHIVHTEARDGKGARGRSPRASGSHETARAAPRRRRISRIFRSILFKDRTLAMTTSYKIRRDVTNVTPEPGNHLTPASRNTAPTTG